MKINTKIKILAVCAAILGAFGVSDATFADSTLTVSPMNQKIILNPGETFEGTIKVSNPNDATEDVKYSLDTSPYSVSGESYESDLSTETSYTVMQDWIRFEKESGSIHPNETVTIKFYIDVPKDAPAGGQYATILVTNDSTTETPETGLSIASVMQISSILYATVTGETRETGEIVSNNIPTFNFATPVNGEFQVKNTGNVHMSSRVTVQVFPLFSDEEVYTNAEEPQSNLIMPETSRLNKIKYEDIPSVGIFKVKQVVKFAGQADELEKVIIVCPMWLLIVIVVVIAGLIFWIFSKTKRRK